jgi:hypothetical protein
MSICDDVLAALHTLAVPPPPGPQPAQLSQASDADARTFPFPLDLPPIPLTFQSSFPSPPALPLPRHCLLRRRHTACLPACWLAVGCTAWALPCLAFPFPCLLACCLRAPLLLARPPARSAQGRAASPRTPMPTHNRHPHPHTPTRRSRPSLLRPVAPRLLRHSALPFLLFPTPDIPLSLSPPSLTFSLPPLPFHHLPLLHLPVTSQHPRM